VKSWLHSMHLRDLSAKFDMGSFLNDPTAAGPA
jgi:hypothetical protein